MEIFVFIRVGGSKERMAVKLLDASGTSLAVRLLHFDAGKARSHLAKDQHALWAVIEASFGTFEPFNMIVRDLLSDAKLDATSTKKPPTRAQSWAQVAPAAPNSSSKCGEAHGWTVTEVR